jgi:glycosyltransferase involved in cell wall biosynthesis
MKLPKISVIVPSYNQGAYIERTIQSILNQRYPNLEIIVMDGGSTDQTLKILKKYSKKIVWFSEKDAGQADAINKGLRFSSGQILAYLNSDDTYEPKALHTIAKYFLKHPKTQFVYGQGCLINKKDKRIGMYNDSPMTHKSLYAACGISQPTAFWTREVYRKIGPFDATLQYTMDYDYWIRVSAHYSLQHLKTPLANTRIHAQSKTSSQTHKLHLDAVRTLLKHYGSVHHDWINTLADGEVSQYKNGNKLQRAYYWLWMFVMTSYYHVLLNHKLPPQKQLEQYQRWIQELRSQLL